MIAPAFLIVGLVLLVAYLARKDPGIDPAQGNRQSLPADTSVPATGVQTPVSPATSFGAPLGSAANNLRLQTSFKITAMNAGRVAMQPRQPSSVAAAQAGAIGPTQADSSVPTQDVPAMVGVKMPAPGVQTPTGNTTYHKL